VSAATAVNFGSAETSEIEVNSPSEITVQAPAGTGKVPVTVAVPEGTTGANPKDMFTYR
jgi:spore coat protein U-like protein